MEALAAVVQEVVQVFAKTHFHKLEKFDGKWIASFEEGPPEVPLSAPQQNLAQEILVTVYQPQRQSKLRQVWDREGEKGIRRHVQVICRGVLCDLQRKMFVRVGEVYADRFGDPASDDGDSDRVEDVVPDYTNQYQCFTLYDLRDELPAEDFELLEKTSNGMTVRELAAGLGISKSAVSRRLVKARKSAREFFKRLRAVEAPNIYAIPRFRNLRPDGISAENIKGFAETLKDRIVPFRDPEAEWKEQYFKSLRKRRLTF